MTTHMKPICFLLAYLEWLLALSQIIKWIICLDFLTGSIQHIKCETVPIKEDTPYPKKELVYFV